MRKNHSPINLFAGADHLSLDQRKFNLTQNDIECICRFFSIGKIQHYEQEKGIVISHSNFFVFVVTTRGQYAFKFYPRNAAKTIAIEYAINRFLVGHHFPTPVMFAGHGGQASFASNGRLTTCFSYVDGQQAWHHIKERNTIRQINAAMLSLKNILSMTKGRIPFLKQENFAATTSAMAQASRAMTPYDQKKMIETSLRDACHTYQDRRPLFTRQWLHNNSTLTNFLINKNTIYTLDLSHIREDYVLSDLAALVISCLFLNIPSTTIKAIIKNYFTQHKIKKDHFLVLNTLVKIGLIKEYFKNVQREKSVILSMDPSELARNYLRHISARKKAITIFLQGPQIAYLR